MVSLLPILIVVAIIISFTLLNKRYKTKPITFHKSKWIIIGYMLILLVAAISSLLLPSTKAEMVEDSVDDHWQNSLYQQALEGNFSSIDSKKIMKKWEFLLTSNTLSLHPSNYEEAFLVERTDDLKDKVEIYLIDDWQVVEVNSVTVDISEYIPEVDIQMDQNILRVVGTDGTADVHLAFAEPEFTTTQFLEEYETGVGYSGSRFYYIRLPENVEIENSDDLPVEEINK